MDVNTLYVLMAQGAGAPAASGQGQLLYLIAMVSVIMVMFYLIIVRPQKREQQRQDAIRNALKKGDRVITIGGIHGTVVGVDTTNNTVSVQVDRNVKIDFSKNAIATVITKDDKGSGESEKKS
jgi:preprotein translocase subunit YajC